MLRWYVQTEPNHHSFRDHAFLKNKQLTFPSFSHTKRYQARLASRPLLTQAVTTAILFGTGDAIAQQAVDKKGLEKHDLARTGRMALYGGGMYCSAHSPACRFSIPTSVEGNEKSRFFFFLQRRIYIHALIRTLKLTRVPGSPFHQKTAVFGPAAATWFKFLARNVNLKSANATIAARVALDQGVFAPCAIGMFLSSMAVLEGGSVSEKLDKNYKNALTTNYMVWPFVQAVNFKMVPLEHRVLFVNVISIGWNCYLSYLNSS